MLSAFSMCRFVGQVTQMKKVATVDLYGAAGTAVGSRIKGHAKRGGSKLTQQHRRHGPVAHTNENRTSRVCSCCFVPVSLSRASRFKDGNIKTIRLNGSVDCKNPLCPRRRAGRGSVERDVNAANNIAIPGASILLSADHKTLPPYRPFALLPTMTASVTNLHNKTPTQGHPVLDAPRDCHFRLSSCYSGYRNRRVRFDNNQSQCGHFFTFIFFNFNKVILDSCSLLWILSIR